MFSKLKEILKESAWDASKQVLTLTLLSCIWGILSGLDDIYMGGTKKCKYTNIWHLHPAKVLICKILEEKDLK